MAQLLTPIITENRAEIAFAKFLERALGDDYLCWHEISIKARDKKRERCPDFIVFNPRYGFWILEVKDWGLDYIQGHNPKQFIVGQKKESVRNPHDQAKSQAFALKDLLRNGGVESPISWGVIFYNIKRDEFEFPEKHRSFSQPGKLGDISSKHVICADELIGNKSNVEFEKRLLSMGDIVRAPIANQLVPVIRDLIFPDIQIVMETSTKKAGKPGSAKLIDFEQEKVFRLLKSGTHVLFGVAGSGKTIILLNKARELIEDESVDRGAILYLCHGTCVSEQIRQQAAKIGVPKQNIFSFHKWCSNLLRENKIEVPRGANDIVSRVLKEVGSGNIKPKYDAILLDEGHDFKDKPEWLGLIASMRKSESSLFVMAYDDAQAIYTKTKQSSFNLNSLAKNGKVEKHILRKNYRNTEEVLLFAKVLASDFLVDLEQEVIPKVRPIGYGAKGKEPLLLECSSLDEELSKVIDEIQKTHNLGRDWSDTVILYNTHKFLNLKNYANRIEKTLTLNKIPCSQKEEEFSKDKVKIMSIKKAKGLGFAMVCIVGVGGSEYDDMDRETDEARKKEHLEEDIRYLYNAITRALEELVITYTTPNKDSFAYRRILKLKTALSKISR